MLAEIYFELGEKEKLKYTCKKIDLLVSDKNTFKQKCLRLEGSNFRLGGIAPISRAVPSFRVPMRLAVLVAWQKGN